MTSFFTLAESGAPRLRLDVWEKGNISIVQLEEKLRGAARQALADAIIELRLLPASLCTEDTPPGIQITTFYRASENIANPSRAVWQLRVQKWGSKKVQRPYQEYTFIADYRFVHQNEIQY